MIIADASPAATDRQTPVTVQAWGDGRQLKSVIAAKAGTRETRAALTSTLGRASCVAAFAGNEDLRARKLSNSELLQMPVRFWGVRYVTLIQCRHREKRDDMAI